MQERSKQGRTRRGGRITHVVSQDAASAHSAAAHKRIEQKLDALDLVPL